MVCNTIHLFRKSLQTKIKTPILDLKHEVKNYLLKNNVKSALIIGTPATVNRGLYSFKEIKSVIPSKREQKILSEAIGNFNRGLNKEKQIKKTKKICLKYLNKNVETVILGCTEFAVMLQNEKFSSINTLDVLVDSVINKLRERSIMALQSAPARRIRVRFSAFPYKVLLKKVERG